MTLNSIRNVFRRNGLIGGCLHYLARFSVKLQIQTIGRFAERFCRLSENRIVFKCFQFLDYSDNARALSDYLIQNGYNGKYQIIWLVSNKTCFRHIHIPNVKFVTAENRYSWSSPAACWYSATAKFFFYTHNTSALNRFHSKGQITVNLWHGCGYKAITSEHAASDLYFFDYMLVPGPLFVSAKAKYWNCSEQSILPLGYPRYDWMLRRSPEQQTRLNKLLPDLTENRKTIIWLPTFRKSGISSFPEDKLEMPFFLPGLRNAADLSEIDELCKEEGLFLIIKKHPREQDWTAHAHFGNIWFLTDQELQNADVNLFTLLGMCDALITDYSSAAVDFLLLNRPIGFVLTDYEQYKATRGFVFDDPLKYMPGEKLYSSADIKNFLKGLSDGEDPWKEERTRLIPEMHNQTDQYCRRLTAFFDI